MCSQVDEVVARLREEASSHFFASLLAVSVVYVFAGVAVTVYVYSQMDRACLICDRDCRVYVGRWMRWWHGFARRRLPTPWRPSSPASKPVQGFLAHKKTHSPRTLQ